MNILSEPFVNNLIHRCSSRQHHTPCALLEFHKAATKIFDKLETELKRNPPLGPDPLPDLDDELQFLLDSDGGNPAISFRTGFCSESERLQAGLESAARLKDSLADILADLDAAILELQQEVVNT